MTAIDAYLKGVSSLEPGDRLPVAEPGRRGVEDWIIAHEFPGLPGFLITSMVDRFFGERVSIPGPGLACGSLVYRVHRAHSDGSVQIHYRSNDGGDHVSSYNKSAPPFASLPQAEFEQHCIVRSLCMGISLDAVNTFGALQRLGVDWRSAAAHVFQHGGDPAIIDAARTA